jgi:signal transduction histidine kinase
VARLEFRHRIGLLLALAAAALIAVTVVTLVLGRRSTQQLTGVETRYVPLLELDRDLKRTAAELAKALEDAAGAGEEGKLDEADRLRDAFTRLVEDGRPALRDNGTDVDAFARTFAAYYTAARAVSQQLVAGTPPAQLVGAIELMRRSREAFVEALATAATPDRAHLAAAFETARASQTQALTIDIVVALVVLTAMGILSWRLIRRTVTSLQAVSSGVERLARGDFATAIEVPPGDEIADLAREANRTASRLRDYREQADRETERAKAALLETQRQARAAESANKELEAFSYSVSHDLRAPLRGIDGFGLALAEDEADRLSPTGHDYLKRIRAGAQRMAELIDDLLRLSRVTRAELTGDDVDLSALVTSVAGDLSRSHPDRTVALTVQGGVTAFADPRLVRIIFENLLGNAWKFTSKAEAAAVEFGCRTDAEGPVYFVRDNGAGFDMKYAERLFGAFQRLHSDKDFPGTGIGLATVQRIVLRHGGRIWVEAAIGRGATFQFTLPARDPATHRTLDVDQARRDRGAVRRELEPEA